mmetsp:Transcript_21240/g.29556  ORF Transcript_21240/g.29556 Transcript_21240/m.29556 type:complete len:258 (-) Transcript_21240:139-912(-)
MRCKGWVGAFRTSIVIAFSGNARRKQIRSTRLCKNNFDIRSVCLDVLSGAMESSSSSISSNPVVEIFVFEIVQNFWTSCCLVKLPVCVGFKLMAQEPPMFFSKLSSLLDHASSLASLGRNDHFSTKHTHELPSFNREGLSHSNDTFISTLSSHHCQSNSSIAGGGFDNCVSRLDLTFFLCCFNDGKCEAVLDGGKRVEKFTFGIDGTTFRAQAIVDFNYWCVSNGLANIIEQFTVPLASSLLQLGCAESFVYGSCRC